MHPRCEDRIAFVLAQFTAMGMTPEEHPKEEARLRTDDPYYVTWCEKLEEWCPDAVL